MKNRPAFRLGLIFVLICVSGGPIVLAHTPVVDSSLSDWCVGAFSNTAPGGGRIEDTGVRLTCGNCSVTTTRACEVNSDCPSGQTCVNLTSKTEIAWWDNRTDGAVNDLGTVVMTSDNTNLYIGAELWVDPDPVSLPFGEIAIDYTSGGRDVWHDPNGVLKIPGHCSIYTDRACTSDADCHFCTISTEPFPSTRVRTCGSACDPGIGDVCQTNQTCLDLGAGGPRKNIGQYGNPTGLADYLVAFDFSIWLIGAGDATLLMRPGATAPWEPVMGCTPDFVGDTTACDFPPAVNPGASGGSGGPPGSVEVAIPWSAFGCTGCPAACNCPGFGPDKPFRFTMTVARGNLTYDFAPDGAHEDVMSEAVAGGSTTTTDSCPGFGIGNTACELSDRNTDAFIPRTPALLSEVPAGGRVTGVRVRKGAGSSIVLDWYPSCSAADDDYEVYEGTVGTWNSHVPVTGLCSTAGATTATFVPDTGDRYYLVVPTNGPMEGSYGKDSAAAERPPSTTPCVIQNLGTCP